MLLIPLKSFHVIFKTGYRCLPWIISLTLLQIPAAKSLKNKKTESNPICVIHNIFPNIYTAAKVNQQNHVFLTLTVQRSLQKQIWQPPLQHYHESQDFGECYGGHSSSLGWWKPNYQASWIEGTTGNHVMELGWLKKDRKVWGISF